MADINLQFGSDDNLKEILRIIKEVDKIIEGIRKSGFVAEGDDKKMRDYVATSMKIASQSEKIEKAKQRQAMQDDKAAQKLKLQSGIIGGLEAEVKKLTVAWKSANTQMEKKAAKKNLDEIKKKLTEAKNTTATWGKALGSFQFKFNALGNIAANVLSRMTQEAKRFIVESLKMAAVAEGVSNAFKKIATTDYMDKLRKATRGAVSDLSLMKATVMAANFKIPLSELTTFLQFAGDRALSTGEDFDFLVESIVKGLGRKSVLILDNLGLSVAEINKEVAKTGDFMTGAAAVIEREMKKAGDVIDTNATKIAQLRSDYQNMQVDFGGWILKNSGLVNSYQRMTDISEADISGFRKFWIAFVRYSDKPIEKYKNQIKEANDEQEELFKQIAKMKEGLIPKTNKEEIETIETLTTKIENLNAEKEITDITDTKNIARINQLIEKYQDQIKVINELGLANKETQKIIQDGLDQTKEFQDEDLDFEENLLNFWRKDLPAAHKWGTDEMIAGSEEYAAELKKIDDQATKDALDNEQKKKDRKAELQDAIINTAFTATDSLARINQNKMNQELANEALTEEQKDAIRRKYAKKDQQIALAEVVMNTAVGMLKLWAKPGFPAAIPLMALLGAQSAMQIAAIKSQKFAEGGEIGGKPHSQGGTIIEAERGEYIVKKSAYQRNKELVNAINAEDSLRIADMMSKDKKIIITKEKDYTKKLYELLKEQPNGYETPEYYVIVKGNQVLKLRKPGKN